MHMWGLKAGIALLAAVVLAVPASAGVESLEWGFYTKASESRSYDIALDETDAVPFVNTTEVAVGDSRARSSYGLMEDDNRIAMSLSFTHEPSLSDGVVVSEGSLTFEISHEGTYSLSGIYRTEGAGLSRMQVKLFDADHRESVLFDNMLVNTESANRELLLGQLDDNERSHLVGSPSGMLPAGRYTLEYAVARQNLPTQTDGVAGAGTIRMIIQPEPASLGLLALGGLAVLRRRR